MDVLDALIALQQVAAPTSAHASDVAAERYLGHLRHKPSLVATARWLGAKADAMHALLPPEVGNALQKNAQPLQRYRCNACGFEGERHYWHCPGCQAWDSYAPLRVEDL